MYLRRPEDRPEYPQLARVTPFRNGCICGAPGRFIRSRRKMNQSLGVWLLNDIFGARGPFSPKPDYCRCSPLANDETTVFLRDATEMRPIEAELKASEENLQLLVNTIPGQVYVTDAQGTLLQVNHHVTEFNGVKLPQLVEDNGMTAVHHEDRPAIIELLQRQLPLGEPFGYEFRHRRSDGVYRWFHAGIQPLKDTHGRVIRWYTLLTDIDDRKVLEASLQSMQAKLAEASRISTVTEITASVAHEVSQPLSAIISNSQACIRYLAAETLNRAALSGAIERVLRDARDASQIIKNIRALFRKKAPETRPIHLLQLIREVLLLHEMPIRQLGINVKVSISEDLPTVPGDKLQIQQVLVNLVRNAVESMQLNSGVPGELEIRVDEADAMVLTTVADRGHGLIDSNKVFDPFFTTKDEGMGMGLRICKTIIEAHDGKLWAASRPDGGAAFTFSLPINIR